MRNFFIGFLKVIRVLLAILFVGVVLLWILNEWFGWGVGYLEGVSVLLMALFTGAGAGISYLGEKRLEATVDQSIMVEGDVGTGAAVGPEAKVKTVVRGDVVEGDKVAGDKVLGDKIMEQKVLRIRAARSLRSRRTIWLELSRTLQAKPLFGI